ncbi:MAG: hypothetical protein HUU48_11175 [Flavobacteriales bacterium]|nr:hypothetical protein [Flavobacteriales bacterium]
MKKIISITYWSLLLIAISTALAFSEKAQNHSSVRSLKIDIHGLNKNLFIDEKDILQIVQPGNDTFKSTYANTLSVMQLEKKINNIPAIKNAEVYKTINGELQISIEQRNPIVRIFNLSGESYYIDEEGTLMPLSNKYTSHVLVVSGNINDRYANRYSLSITNISENDTLKNISLLDDIFLLAQYIHSNPFWKAQIEHLYVNKDFEFELIPRVGNHRIVFGDATQIDEKFNKLKFFYKKALNKIGWNEYKTINIKFNNQVVCSKN